MKTNMKGQIYKLLLVLVVFLIANGCDNLPLFPTAKTKAVTEISSGTAICGGTIVNENNVTTTIQGVCWGKVEKPTIADSKTISKNISRDFTAQLTGLLPETTYFVRAYLSNSDGTVYGNEVSFTTTPIAALGLLT